MFYFEKQFRCASHQSSSRRDRSWCLPLRQRGFSLVEMLLVITTMAVLAAVALPRFNSGIHEQLNGVARVIAADLELIQEVAAANGTSFQLTFSTERNQYSLEDVGPRKILSTVEGDLGFRLEPISGKQVKDVSHLSVYGPTVRLCGLQKRAPQHWHASGATPGDSLVAASSRNTLDVSPLGDTKKLYEHVIWLESGMGDSLCFIPITVAPVTGLVCIGRIQKQKPPLRRATIDTVAPTEPGIGVLEKTAKGLAAPGDLSAQSNVSNGLPSLFRPEANY